MLLLLINNIIIYVYKELLLLYLFNIIINLVISNQIVFIFIIKLILSANLVDMMILLRWHLISILREPVFLI